MPRQGRLHVPGAIYHLISRGIDRSTVFKDHRDREEFLRRLAVNLKKISCTCLAWALMPNHIHLLLSPDHLPLGIMMRKLLTGYALYFNRRHQRTGYLFQNRYKAILCQKETYFLELVRYIHLNPVRAGLVKRISELDHNPWTGHSALVGKIKREWQSQAEVLQHFNEHKKQALHCYRQFIQDGWAMGHKPEFYGAKSSKNRQPDIVAEKKKWVKDGRVLGDEVFVNEVFRESELPKFKSKSALDTKGSIDQLAQTVTSRFAIEIEQLKHPSRNARICQARFALAFLSYQKGISQKEISEFLGISISAVCQSIEKAKIGDGV